jgi:hypothetical protein
MEGKKANIFYIDGRTSEGQDHVSCKTGVVLEVNSNFIMLQLGSAIGNKIGIPRERIVRVELLEDEKKP